MENVNSLNYRKKQIDREKSAISFSCVCKYALRFRDHLSSFFDKCADGVNRALNWARLNVDERKTHLQKIFKHLMSFGGQNYDVELKLGGRHPTDNALGGATAKKVALYDKLLGSSDYNQVVEVVAHEVGHVFQLNNAGTTLSKDTVDICYAHYVLPHESYEYYFENPIEAEAWIIGREVGRNFKQDLQKRSCPARAA